MAVQWLGLHTSTAGGTGSIPGGDPANHVMWEKKKKKIQKVNDLLFCDDEVMQPFLGIQFPYCLDSVRYWREDISFILEASYTSLGREAEERSEI